MDMGIWGQEQAGPFQHSHTPQFPCDPIELVIALSWRISTHEDHLPAQPPASSTWFKRCRNLSLFF